MAHRPLSSDPRPIAFAHRGGAALHPENTIVAFRHAIELGCSYIETDIHLTRDGQIVVFHDHRLERTTDGTGFVRDHTLAELQRLDAGHHFTRDGKTFPFRNRNVTIPTLAEAVALDPNVRFNLEIKERASGLPAALWRFIERHGLHERLLAAAFEAPLLHEFRALSRGSVATSAAQREVIAFWLASRAGAARLLHPRYDALQVPARHGRITVVDPRFVRAAHLRGIAVHVWTIDEPREMRRLLALGVDGIMTDRPDLLLAVLASSSRTDGSFTE